jgi:hypothetical protein
MHRRRFLQITGISGFGVASGLPRIGLSFDGIPPSEQNFIQVCGIYPDPASIGPKGAHLRWTLPPSKGFPEVITIYRRSSKKQTDYKRVAPSESGESSLPAKLADVQFSGYSPKTRFQLTVDKSGYRNATLTGTETLRITFPILVDYCKVVLGDTKPIISIGFAADNKPLYTVTLNESEGRSNLEFTASERKIKYIEIPLNFRMLYSVEYYSDQLACAELGWDKIGGIDNENDFAQAKSVLERIQPSATFNYYLPESGSERQARLVIYEKNARYYQAIYQVLKPSNELVLKPRDSSNRTRIKAWNVLQFVAIDPNIARMLGFYFVDSKINDEPKGSFDYKVEAKYPKGKEVICGILHKLEKAYSASPKLQPNLIATQTGTSWWEFEENIMSPKHWGKVRLSWPSSPAPGIDDYIKRFTTPVVYAYQRNNSAARLVSPQREKTGANRFFFFDRKVDLGTANLRIRGIDIFGRQSDALETTCPVKDNDVPPPPSKLCFAQTEETIKLRFEYGATEYLAGPDAKEFVIHQRNDSVFDGKKVRFTLQTDRSNDSFGTPIYKLSLINPGTPLDFQFFSFVAQMNGAKLAASARKKFKIQSISGTTLSFACGTDYQPPANGWLLLTRAPGTRSSEWQQPPVATVSTIPPTSSTLSDYTHFITGTDDQHYAGGTISPSKCFHCNAIAILHQEAKRDVFEKPGVAPSGPFAEILIDRELLIPEMFNDGTVNINGNPYTIVYQSSGEATPPGVKAELDVNANRKNEYARIVVSDVAGLPADLTSPLALQLYLPVHSDAGDRNRNKLHGYVILRLSPGSTALPNSGGEFLLKGKRFHLVEDVSELEDCQVIGRVCSDLKTDNTGSQIEVLAYLDKRIHFLLTSGAAVFFPAYETDVTQKVEDLTIGANQPHASAYFAVETVDKSSPQNISPLSTIAQFIKTRSGDDKPARPAEPFPCENNAATAGYLKPPNMEGRSRFCLQWDGSTNGLRYEVGRALDKTIISVHQSAWLKGKLDAPGPLTTAEFSENEDSALQVSPLNTVNGLVEASSAFHLDSIAPEIFDGGRLIQGTGENRKTFEVVKSFKDGANLKLVLRPPIKGVSPTNSKFRLEALPNYSAVLDDPEQRKTLCNSCPSAFSVVTGNPLRGTNRFLDSVPGKGSSRFFYKVRAVDASENRSDWSDASVAIYQADTTVPGRTEGINIQRVANKTYIRWPNIRDRLIKSYRIYRQINGSAELIAELFDSSWPNGPYLSHLPLRIRHGKLDLGEGLPHAPAVISSDNGSGILGVYKRKTDGSPDLSTNYLVSQVTTLTDAVVSNVSPLLAENVAVIVVLLNRRVTAVCSDQKGLQIKSISNAIRLGQPYPVRQVLGIYLLSQFDYSKEPLSEQAVTNLLTTDMTFDANRQVIMNTSTVPNTEGLVIVVDGYIPSIIQGGEGNPLKVTNASISLDGSQVHPGTIVDGIYASDSYEFAKSPAKQSAHNYCLKRTTETSGRFLVNLLCPLSESDGFVIAIRMEQPVSDMFLDNDPHYWEHVIESIDDESDRGSKYQISAVKPVLVMPSGTTVLLESVR